MVDCVTQADLSCPVEFDQNLIDFLNELNRGVKANCEAINDLLNFTCVPVTLRDNSIATQNYGRSDFDFSDISPQAVRGSGPLPVTVSASNTGVTLFAITANRFKIGANNNPGTSRSAIITFQFDRPICDAVIRIRDVDFPTEDFDGWSKAPDSVSPGFGNEVISFVTFTDINSTTLTVTYTTVAEAVDIYFESVTTCAPCFSAQRCTNSLGALEYRNAAGNRLTGSYTEC